MSIKTWNVRMSLDGNGSVNLLADRFEDIESVVAKVEGIEMRDGSAGLSEGEFKSARDYLRIYGICVYRPRTLLSVISKLKNKTFEFKKANPASFDHSISVFIEIEDGDVSVDVSYMSKSRVEFLKKASNDVF